MLLYINILGCYIYIISLIYFDLLSNFIQINFDVNSILVTFVNNKQSYNGKHRGICF
jgi:hypothetical protein